MAADVAVENEIMDGMGLWRDPRVFIYAGSVSGDLGLVLCFR